jgi:hypothetical protein
MNYEFHPGFRLKKADSQEVGEALAKIEAARGSLEPEAILDAAKDPASPLHKLFEWDDDRAAHEYRLHQARYLIRAIYSTAPDMPAHRVFVSVATAGRREYRDAETAVKTVGAVESAVGQLLSQIAGTEKAVTALVALMGGQRSKQAQVVREAHRILSQAASEVRKLLTAG